MTRPQFLIAGMALIPWSAAVFWFFHRDLVRWWHQRSVDRVERKKQAAAMAAERARMLDELAERHPLPPRVPRSRP